MSGSSAVTPEDVRRALQIVCGPIFENEGFMSNVPLAAPRLRLFRQTSYPLAPLSFGDLPPAELLSAAYLPASVPDTICAPAADASKARHAVTRRHVAAGIGFLTFVLLVLGTRVALAVHRDPSLLDGVYVRGASLPRNALSFLHWLWYGRRYRTALHPGDAAAGVSARSSLWDVIWGTESDGGDASEADTRGHGTSGRGGLSGAVWGAAQVTVRVVTHTASLAARAAERAAATAAAAAANTSLGGWGGAQAARAYDAGEEGPAYTNSDHSSSDSLFLSAGTNAGVDATAGGWQQAQAGATAQMHVAASVRPVRRDGITGAGE
jgi:hypothetical protein